MASDLLERVGEWFGGTKYVERRTTELLMADLVATLRTLLTTRAEVERLKAWEVRAVRSMDAACAALGVGCCDDIPAALAERERDTKRLDWLETLEPGEAQLIFDRPFDLAAFDLRTAIDAAMGKEIEP